MYSVILVEDEQLVRQELAATTPWEQLGLRLIATCGDGIDGENKIRLLDPDIVITDIRLPGQDGLTMLKHCQVPHAVILSGYTDFSYTRTAIQLSVFDYLQKPVDSGQLEETLSSLVEKIKGEEQDLARFRSSVRGRLFSRYQSVVSLTLRLPRQNVIAWI